MTDDFALRRDNNLRLIAALKHASILAETDDFLSEDSIYKLISFCSPSDPPTILQLYGELRKKLDQLINGRYEWISGDVLRRFMLLFRLPELSYRADSVWIDSVASELAQQFGVVYSSSMPVRGLFALRGAHIQVIEEEEFNYYASRSCHREENGEADETMGDFFSERLLFDNLARRFELSALAGKQKQLELLRDEALEKAIYLSPYSIEEVHRRIEMFIHSLLNRLDRDGCLETHEKLHQQVLNRLLFCDTEKELRERACELSAQLLQLLQGAQQNSKAAADHIRRYIDENLEDVNLCVTSLAEAFERKSRSLDELFRQHYGISVFRYIQAQRLALAERLLAETRLDVIQVCERAGYGSINTMLRAFKQAHAVSPSVFRSQNQNR